MISTSFNLIVFRKFHNKHHEILRNFPFAELKSFCIKFVYFYNFTLFLDEMEKINFKLLQH